MSLSLDPTDFRFVCRGIGEDGAVLVNQLRLTGSLILSPDRLQENWPIGSATELRLPHTEAILAFSPEVVLLGTGDRQIFPHGEFMAGFLGRSIGIEVMNNPAAARTFNVLAGEGRKVVAAFIVEPAP